MRVFVAVMALVAMLLSGCSGDQPVSAAPSATTTSTASSTTTTPTTSVVPIDLRSVSIPGAKTDLWIDVEQLTLQGAADSYGQAWSQALGSKSGFDGRVVVGMIFKDSEAQAYCAKTAVLAFSPKGNDLLYCRTVPRGPDPLTQPGTILVPGAWYQLVMPTDGTAQAEAGARLMAAMLMAMAYSQHVIAELYSHGQLSAQDAVTLLDHTSCVAGMSLRSYFKPPVIEAQWYLGWRYVTQFEVAGAPALDLRQLMRGFDSGRLKACLSSETV